MVETVPCIVGSLAASLASAHYMSVATALSPRYANQKCHHAWPNVSWGALSPTLRGFDFNEWQNLAGQPQSQLWGGAHAGRQVKLVTLPRPTGTTQDSSGMPAPRRSRSLSSAKHGGWWFHLHYRLTHPGYRVICGHLGAEPLPPCSLSGSLSLPKSA